MAYLQEFLKRLNAKDYNGVMSLWEEYCAGDQVDTVELLAILKAFLASDFAKTFGKYAETALLLWEQIKDEEQAYLVLKAILDLQTSNSPRLIDLTMQVLERRFKQIPDFQEKLRLAGVKNRNQFQGVLSRFELLAHMQKGKFVFHTGGWGTGEIMDVSFLREQLTLEFENLQSPKDLSFTNAFNTLVPLADNHFLARRFGNPDRLEQEAKEDPVAVIHLLLKDLGPKTSSEIKDELYELVIAEKDWAKWWQAARTKVKKDTMIQSPEGAKDPFVLREKELLHDERVLDALRKQKDEGRIVEMIYTALRDHPLLGKNADARAELVSYLHKITSKESLITSLFLLQDLGEVEATKKLKEIIRNSQDPSKLVQEVSLVSFKKRLLLLIKEEVADWPQVFLKLLFILPVHTLREYLMREIKNSVAAPLLKEKIAQLCMQPQQQPEFFVWYFQQVVDAKSSKEEELCLLESLILLFSRLESLALYKDLLKKIQLLLSENNFARVRKIIQGASIAYLKEFLLLVTKCHTLSEYDQKILHSLCSVVHPSLGKKEEEESFETIWTTKEGYLKAQARVQHIGTVETVDNAKEIEAARALGDLRENSEYKFALERRAQLQGEIKFLTGQLTRARIITEQDIPKSEVGVGSVVELVNKQGEKSKYTLLGPWDADPDHNILSLQSKFAKSMLGKKKGQKFSFQEDEYTVHDIQSFLWNYS